MLAAKRARNKLVQSGWKDPSGTPTPVQHNLRLAPLPISSPLSMLPSDCEIRLFEPSYDLSSRPGRTTGIDDLADLRRQTRSLYVPLPAQYQAAGYPWVGNHWAWDPKTQSLQRPLTLDQVQRPLEARGQAEFGMLPFTQYESAVGLDFGADINPLSAKLGAAVPASDRARSASGIDRLSATLSAPLLQELGSYTEQYIPQEVEMGNVVGGIRNAKALIEFKREKMNQGVSWFPLYGATYTDDAAGKAKVTMIKGRH